MRIATLEELAFAHWLITKAHHQAGQVECDHRIAYHSSQQEAVHVITPTPRYIAALMAGGYVRRERVVGADTAEARAARLVPEPMADRPTGLPIMEGSGEVLGPMTYDEAIAFVAWKDMPQGVNHFQILTTDDLPHIGGSIDNASIVATNGMLFVTSGYGLFGQMPGNVLLAFKPKTQQATQR